MRHSLLCLGLLLPLGLPLGLNAAPAQQGLRASYYAGRNFERLVLSRPEASINYVWTRKSRDFFGSGFDYQAPAPGVPAEDFSVRWTGQLRAPESGTFTLQASVDDGMRVYLGDDLVLDAWQNQPTTAYTVQVELQAGATYALRVEYYQARFESEARLSWVLPSAAPNAAPKPIASAYLSPPVEVRPKPLRPQPMAAPPMAQVPPQAQPAQGPPPIQPMPEPPPPFGRPAQRLAAPGAMPARLAKGTSLTLPNLFFDINSADLAPASAPTLDALAQTLLAQSELAITIAGHTDLARNRTESLKLSADRAKAIKDYLVEAGIDPARLSTEAYGFDKPLVPGRDPRNRRVVVTVR